MTAQVHRRPKRLDPSASPEMQTIAKNLRALRLARKHSQTFLAEVIGVHQSAVSRIEKAEQELSNRQLVLVSNLYGPSVDELLRGEVRV